MPSALKMDPTRTTMLRGRFVREMNKRFALIRRAVMQFIVDDDAFGLVPLDNYIIGNIEKGAYRFLSDSQKQAEFRKWLQQQVDDKLLMASSTKGKPWMSPYIESAYKKGQTRAYRDTYRELLDSPQAMAATKNGSMLGVSFMGSEETKRIEAIYTRAWGDLKGVTDAMGQKLSRHLALGLANGEGPRSIARKMAKDIDGITRTRARMIARTEIIAAHAEGQLDAFDKLGLDQLTVMAEFSTAGDDRVCESCSSLEGEVMTVEEARGLIPVHPNCRCCFVPATARTGGMAQARSMNRPLPDPLVGKSKTKSVKKSKKRKQ